jgi:hypothetical protein
LFWHDARRAASRARASAGSSIAASMPMIAMTTSSSIYVNPRGFLIILPPLKSSYNAYTN